MLKFSFKLLLF